MCVCVFPKSVEHTCTCVCASKYQTRYIQSHVCTIASLLSDLHFCSLFFRPAPLPIRTVYRTVPHRARRGVPSSISYRLATQSSSLQHRYFGPGPKVCVCLCFFFLRVKLLRVYIGSIEGHDNNVFSCADTTRAEFVSFGMAFTLLRLHVSRLFVGVCVFLPIVCSGPSVIYLLSFSPSLPPSLPPSFPVPIYFSIIYLPLSLPPSISLSLFLSF